MGFIKGLFRLIVGAVFGLVAGMALSPAIGAFANAKDGGTAWVLLVVIAIGALLGVFAPTIRRAFGRGFLLAGVAVLALPLSAMLLSGRVLSEMSPELQGNSAKMAGAGIGAALMTGAAGFVGFFLGAILIIVGLVIALGGRRQVVMVTPDGRPYEPRIEPR